MDDPRNILVFLPNWAGDVVMATPALRALRGHFSAARITYFGRKIALDTMGGTAWADAMILDRSATAPALVGFAKAAMELRAGGFDLAVLFPNSFRTAALTRLGAGIGHVAGYDRDGRGWLLWRKLKPKRDKKGRLVPVPQIDYYNDLVVELGVSDPGRQMELPVALADDAAAGQLLAESGRGAAAGPLVMLNPGASFGPSKLWLPERFAAVADALIESRNAQVIINAAPAEKPIAAAVAAAMKRQPLINFAQRPNSLGLLKGLLRRCDLLITNDTGARHFAASLGCGVVTIFGSTDPTWAQIDYPRERIIRTQVECSPCQSKQCLQPPGETFHQCMKAVTTDIVLSAAMELLADRPREGRA